MNCAICLSFADNPNRRAITVMDGYAVCQEHLSFVSDSKRWAEIYYAVREAARPRQESNLRPPT